MRGTENISFFLVATNKVKMKKQRFVFSDKYE